MKKKTQGLPFNAIIIAALSLLVLAIITIIIFSPAGYCEEINKNYEYNSRSYYDATHISCCENEKRQVTLEDGRWKEIYNKTCYAYEKVNGDWVKR